MVHFREAVHITRLNFMVISQTTAHMWQFIDFSKMAAIRHFEFVVCI